MTVLTGMSGSSRAYDAIDLSSRAFWSTTAAERERSFAVLRAERPVSWHPPVEDALMDDPGDRGYWAVTRRSDIVTVSRNNEVFLSGKGVIFENVPVELLEASQSFLAMDPPRHTKLRKLVSAAFTPRQVRRIEDSIKTNAKAIVEELRAAGSGVDFVDHCAKELPIRTLSDMVGIPESERQHVAHAADALVSWADPVYLDGRNPMEVLVENQMYLHQVAGALAAERRKRPGDDLFSSLVNAEVDGDRLTDADVAAFFVLLAVAANDTTRQTTSHAMKALTDFPGERAWLLAGFRRPYWHGGRGVHPMGLAGHDLPSDGRNGFRTRRPNHSGGGEGGDVLSVGQLGHRGVRPSGAFRPEPQSQPTRRIRWRRSALLPRSSCGPGATARYLRRAAPPAAGYPGRRSGIRAG